MKNVIRQYAAAVIAVIVGLGILGVLYSASFGSYQTFFQYVGMIAGELLASERTAYQTGTAFDTYMEEKMPEISEPEYLELAYGVDTSIAQVIKTKDSNGDVASITIDKVCNSDFNKTKYVTITADNQIHLLRNDIYWIEITVTDHAGNSRTVLVRICGGKV